MKNAPIIAAAIAAGACASSSSEFAAVLTRVAERDPARAQHLATAATTAERVDAVLGEMRVDRDKVLACTRAFGCEDPAAALAAGLGIVADDQRADPKLRAATLAAMRESGVRDPDRVLEMCSAFGIVDTKRALEHLASMYQVTPVHEREDPFTPRPTPTLAATPFGGSRARVAPTTTSASSPIPRTSARDPRDGVVWGDFAGRAGALHKATNT